MGSRAWARKGRAGPGGAAARPGECRVPSRPQGGTLALRPAYSGGQLGADPRWPGTCLPVTQPRVENVVRRLRRYAPPPPARERAVQREAETAPNLERSAGAWKQDAGAGEEVGLRRGAQQRVGPLPSGTQPTPGPGGRADPARQFAGGRGGGRAEAGTRRLGAGDPFRPGGSLAPAGRKGRGWAARGCSLCSFLVQAELRAEAPCWEAAPLVLVSGNRGAAGRAGGSRALSEDGGPSAAWRGHPEAEPAAGLRARSEGRQRHLRGRL